PDRLLGSRLWALTTSPARRSSWSRAAASPGIWGRAASASTSRSERVPSSRSSTRAVAGAGSSRTTARFGSRPSCNCRRPRHRRRRPGSRVGRDSGRGSAGTGVADLSVMVTGCHRGFGATRVIHRWAGAGAALSTGTAKLSTAAWAAAGRYSPVAGAVPPLRRVRSVEASSYALPRMRLTVIPQTGQLPLAILIPVLETLTVPSKSRFVRHLTQYPLYIWAVSGNGPTPSFIGGRRCPARTGRTSHSTRDRPEET